MVGVPLQTKETTIRRYGSSYNPNKLQQPYSETRGAEGVGLLLIFLLLSPGKFSGLAVAPLRRTFKTKGIDEVFLRYPSL